MQELSLIFFWGGCGGGWKRGLLCDDPQAGKVTLCEQCVPRQWGEPEAMCATPETGRQDTERSAKGGQRMRGRHGGEATTSEQGWSHAGRHSREAAWGCWEGSNENPGGH